MKVVKSILATIAGIILTWFGLFALGVPSDLPTWRYLTGIGFVFSAIVVWDKWS